MTAFSSLSHNCSIVVVLKARDCRATKGAHVNMIIRKASKK